MQYRAGSKKREALWLRYWAIDEGRAGGFTIPILWHLALRGDGWAMTELANVFDKEGRIADPFSQSGLYRRAHRGGYEYAAQHLAMDAFNRNDLTSYRH